MSEEGGWTRPADFGALERAGYVFGSHAKCCATFGICDGGPSRRRARLALLLFSSVSEELRRQREEGKGEVERTTSGALHRHQKCAPRQPRDGSANSAPTSLAAYQLGSVLAQLHFHCHCCCY